MSLWVGVVLLSVLDVTLSPVFILLMGFAGSFSMTMLSVEAVLLIGTLMCFVCPIAAIVAARQRASRGAVLAIALLPAVVLAGAFAMMKILGMPL